MAKSLGDASEGRGFHKLLSEYGWRTAAKSRHLLLIFLSPTPLMHTCTDTLIHIHTHTHTRIIRYRYSHMSPHPKHTSSPLTSCASNIRSYQRPATQFTLSFTMSSELSVLRWEHNHFSPRTQTLHWHGRPDSVDLWWGSRSEIHMV